MLIYDLFCDASIDLESRVACAGCTVVEQSGRAETFGLIQKEATNNSAEILAIWLGVRKAIEIRDRYMQSNETQCLRFRLFSDSKISLYGVKMWIFSWMRRQSSEGLLINSSGGPVANQEYFIDIYNSIVKTKLHIEFYHQRGHICIFDSEKLEKAARDFKNANHVPLERIGADIRYISKHNDIVDNSTRDVVHQYILEGYNPFIGSNFTEELERPMEFLPSLRDSSLYRNLISNGNNYIHPNVK